MDSENASSTPADAMIPSNFGRVFVKICWGGTLAAACLAVWNYLGMAPEIDSAPKEAAAAAVAVAIVVIPYVFTRAVEGLVGSPK